MAPPATKVSLSLRDRLSFPESMDTGMSATAIPLLMLKKGEADEKCGDALEEL